MKSASPQRTLTAHDTLQRLNYATRPAFNALWEPKDTISIDVKATKKRNILGDEYLESIIKERPRIYMTPCVSLDDVEDKDLRKLLIDFTYETVTRQATKDVWGDFEIQSLCSLQRHMEEQEKPLIDQRRIFRLPVKFQGIAKKWDDMQIRSLFEICHDKTKAQKETTQEFDRPETHADEEMFEKEHAIKKLICENKLNIFYDKLPLSYTGYRPYVAHGVPLEKKETCQLSITN